MGKKMNVEFGNASAVDTRDTGWVVGFSDWSKSASGLRYIPRDTDVRSLCIKWYLHQPGDPNGTGKPVSEGRTFSILAGTAGEFRIDFSETPAFDPASTITHVLREPGDFLIWGDGVYHRWSCVKPSCILTVRWAERNETRM
jgi:hypothetical protein